MHDDDSGSEQQSGWEPPGYVSPWMPASSSGDQDQGTSDTVSFGSEPGYVPPAGGYVPPGYVPPGYAGPGYPPPGYVPQPGYGAPAWAGYGTPPPPASHSGFGRALAYVAVAVVAAGAGAGAAIALNHTTAAPVISPASGNTGNSGGQVNPFSGNGFGLPPGSSGTGGSGGTGTLNVSALATKVDPGIVDITSQLKYSDATAEGTGVIISPSGLVLTNNHVIDEATSVSATLVVSNRTYRAEVLGYDATDDVALLQLVGAANLTTISPGDSAKVQVGQPVLALGNAGGRGGLPSTAEGTIRALNQSIKASDSGAKTTENLHGMIQTNAPIQQGDSGGPLVNASGQVIGMDTAANSVGYGTEPTATTGFAIPINHALSIASEIKAGHASATVHLGLAGFMGVNIANASSPADCSASGGTGFGGFGGYTPAVKSGALICDVYPSAPAQQGGLTGGDVITSVDGKPVTTADGLTKLMASDHPGDRLTIGYVNQSGAQRTAIVTLTEWAK